MKDRKANPRDDILSLFIDAEVDSQRLTDDEILGICFLFILAGLDTVTDSLECFVARLAQNPAERRQIVDDPAIIPSAVEELLRWETPVTTVARVATQDVELGGCPIRAGENVGIVIGSANTDEEAVPGSDQVDLTGARTGIWPSGVASTAASGPTWPGSSCGSPCANGIAAYPSTRSSRVPSSTT